jgi:hypoxanthine phosphoribosyltransferase
LKGQGTTVGYEQDDVEVFLSTEKVQARVRELGAQITREHATGDLTVIAVMKGALPFAMDLVRAIDRNLSVEVLGVSSYQGGTETTGEVRITHDVTKPLSGKHLLVVEDIIDTGLTMKFLIENLKARHPASLKISTLLEKPSRARVTVPIDYKGFVIEDKFVVGYGLDFDEKYRNLPYIGVMKGH